MPYLGIGLTGILMGLGAAPANLWWLVWVMLTPLWLAATSSKSCGKAGLLGFAWGLGYHGYSLAWITGLHPLTWMGMSWLTSLVVATSCWLFVSCWGALIPILWAMGLNRLQHWGYQQPLIQLLTGVTLWCGLEWLWGRSFLWWTSLTLTQATGNLPILHLGRLSGPTTVVAGIVLVNGLLAIAWQAWVWKQVNWKAWVLAACVCWLCLHGLGWGLALQPLADQPEKSLKVGIIQGNIPTKIKLYPQGLQQAMQRYTEGYQQLATQGVDAVLTPEAALPYLFIWADEQRQQTPFWQALRQTQVPIWMGSFVDNGQAGVTQSLLTLLPNGKVLSRYDKIKLVPLGEYIPFQDTLGQLIQRLSPIKSSLVSGAEGQQFPTPWSPAITGICFDSAFSYLFRNQAAAGGEFILTASNNNPYNARMMIQHHAQDVMRAIETDRWAARATNTGYSAIVDPHGQTRWISGVDTLEVHADQLYRRQTQTLYVRWGDWLMPVLLGTSLGSLWLMRTTRISPRGAEKTTLN